MLLAEVEALRERPGAAAELAQAWAQESERGAAEQRVLTARP